MKKHKWLLIAVAILVVPLGVVAYKMRQHQLRTDATVARDAGSPLPVKTATANTTDLAEVIGIDGVAQPLQFLNLSSGLSTPVREILVDIGDLVTRDQELIKFDRQLLGAVFNINRAVADAKANERDRAQQEYKRLQEAYNQGLASAILDKARANLESAKNELERARNSLQRSQEIYEKRYLSKDDLEKAQAQVDKAGVNYATAQEQMLEAQKDLQSELDKALSALLRAEVDCLDAKQKFERAQSDLKDATLVSSVPGIVMEKTISPGETPQASQKLLTIGQIDSILVEANVVEEKIADIYLGQKASLTFNAFPNELFAGEVVKVKPVTDQKIKSFVIYVKVANPEMKLKPGLSSFIRINKTKKVLTVPSVALINPTGRLVNTVFCVDDTLTARLKEVKIGNASEGMTEIVEGVKSGERVVVVGQIELRDGDKVLISEQP